MNKINEDLQYRLVSYFALEISTHYTRRASCLLEQLLDVITDCISAKTRLPTLGAPGRLAAAPITKEMSDVYSSAFRKSALLRPPTSTYCVALQ